MSAETCALKWYQAFTAQCAFGGGLTGATIGGALGATIGGAALSFATFAFAAAFFGVGAVVAWCTCRTAGRLRKVPFPPRDPASGLTTVMGKIIGLGRSSIHFPFGDGDWTFNIATTDANVLGLAFDGNPACVRTEDLAAGPQFLHCEITSHVHAFGCAGAIAGAVIGAAVGTGLGIAAGAAIAAGCAAAGIFAPLCLLVALLVAAIIAGASTAAGAYLGGATGGLLGAAADELDNQLGDADADTIHEGDCVIFTGEWVTDRDHGWNEIHDIKTAMILDAGDCRKLTGAVGAGLRAHHAAAPPIP